MRMFEEYDAHPVEFEGSCETPGCDGGAEFWSGDRVVCCGCADVQQVASDLLGFVETLRVAMESLTADFGQLPKEEAIWRACHIYSVLPVYDAFSRREYPA